MVHFIPSKIKTIIYQKAHFKQFLNKRLLLYSNKPSFIFIYTQCECCTVGGKYYKTVLLSIQLTTFQHFIYRMGGKHLIHRPYKPCKIIWSGSAKATKGGICFHINIIFFSLQQETDHMKSNSREKFAFQYGSYFPSRSFT